ncbi:MAG: hypothetical protein JST11_23700, partial [Acidobacteria bacterium]|nr:hypothetical protein [Acidobacteriota bacterium]
MNLRLAAPAILLASLLLLPFLDKPFTIDDPLYLRAGAHALTDPAHPGDFEQVWNAGDRLKLSQYWLGATLPAYLLAPVAALGSKEWVAHLYQWMFLCWFLISCVAVARRLGCDAQQANLAGVLAGSNPVALAMASTCMPDVMAVAFGTAGMERVLAFREERRVWAGAAAALLLAAAVLCRASTVLLLGTAVLLLLPASWKKPAGSLWPVAAAFTLAAGGTLLTRGATGAGSVGAALQTLTGLRNVPRNAVSFLAFEALTGPILLYWILVRGRRALAAVAAVTAGGIALSLLPFENMRQYAVPAALGLCFLAA